MNITRADFLEVRPSFFERKNTAIKRLIIPIALALALFAASGCAGHKTMLTRSELSAMGQNPAFQKEMKEKLDEQIVSVWRSVKKCPTANADKEAKIYVNAPKSLLGRYVLDVLTKTKPIGVGLYQSSENLDVAPEEQLAKMEASGIMSIASYADRKRVELEISVIGVNQLLLCVEQKPNQKDFMPYFGKSVALETFSFNAAVAGYAPAFGKALKSVVYVDSVNVKLWDKTTDKIKSLGELYLMPDLQVCAESDKEKVCSNVFYDQSGVRLDMAVRAEKSIKITVKNVDELGNVEYPFESKKNKTLAEFNLAALPSELLLNGFAEISSANEDVTISLGYEMAEEKPLQRQSPQGGSKTEEKKQPPSNKIKIK